MSKSNPETQDILARIAFSAISAIRDIGVVAASGLAGSDAADVKAALNQTAASDILVPMSNCAPEAEAVKAPDTAVEQGPADPAPTTNDAPAEQPRRRGRPPKNKEAEPTANPAANEPVSNATAPEPANTNFAIFKADGDLHSNRESAEAAAESISGLVREATDAEMVDMVLEANATTIDALPRTLREQITEGAALRKQDLNALTTEAVAAVAPAEETQQPAGEARDAIDDIFGEEASEPEPEIQQVTADQARKALQDLLSAYGPTRKEESRLAGLEILKGFGVEKFQALAESDYGAFHAEVTAKIAEVRKEAA